MKKILAIGTGGTIASLETADGLSPQLLGEELIKHIPEIGNMCEVECIQVINMDSTNIRPGHWLKISEAIQEKYNEYDGFIITHGTDTMAYTAAGISYLIQNSVKPIAITGAQIPLMEQGSDARRNLIDAFTYVCDSESHGISIIFNGSVIIGTRARKNFSKSFAAFGSINYPEVAHIQGGRIVRFINDKPKEETKFYDFINPNVGILKLVPGMRNDVMKYFIDHYDGLVVESFGVGGLPEYSDFYEQIKRAVKNGKLIVMTTQVPNEGSDLSIYRVGNILKKQFNVLEAHDMTSEAAFAKVMWILGQTSDFEKAEELFYTNIANDILFK